jgi:uncharacterized damage-inducible protein DinB
MSLGKNKKLWIDRYLRVQKIRDETFNDLGKPEIDQEWIIKRPNAYQWAVDEIIRHQLYIEIKYLQQSFDPTRTSHPVGVKAQWAEETIMNLEESEHVVLKDLKKLFPPVQVVSEELLREAADLDYERPVKSPWGKMKAVKLLDYWYDHEMYHRGQIYMTINLHKGPPKGTH